MDFISVSSHLLLKMRETIKGQQRTTKKYETDGVMEQRRHATFHFKLLRNPEREDWSSKKVPVWGSHPPICIKYGFTGNLLYKHPHSWFWKKWLCDGLEGSFMNSPLGKPWTLLIYFPSSSILTQTMTHVDKKVAGRLILHKFETSASLCCISPFLGCWNMKV